jgi:hypothetical protein
MQKRANGHCNSRSPAKRGAPSLSVRPDGSVFHNAGAKKKTNSDSASDLLVLITLLITPEVLLLVGESSPAQSSHPLAASWDTHDRAPFSVSLLDASFKRNATKHPARLTPPLPHCRNEGSERKIPTKDRNEAIETKDRNEAIETKDRNEAIETKRSKRSKAKPNGGVFPLPFFPPFLISLSPDPKRSNIKSPAVEAAAAVAAAAIFYPDTCSGTFPAARPGRGES